MASEKRIEDRQLAFLVDGDNASATHIEEMLAEASKYGSVIIRRVYGNWTAGGQVNTWKTKLKEYALTPTQVFPNISNRHVTKNATDIVLIIDAMDILHDGIVKGFVIVSSDSDYTSLALKIREHGLFVIGIGKKETHDSFRRACDVFVSTENLGKGGEEEEPDAEETPAAPRQPRRRKTPRDALDILNKAFDYAVNDDGRALNGDIGAALRRLDPAFDTRTYGRPSLLNLIEDLGAHFEVDRSGNAIYVRRKDYGYAPQEPERREPARDQPRERRHEKAAEPVEEQQIVSDRTPLDALPFLIQAFDSADKNPDGTLDTFRLFKAAKKLDPSFDSALYGKEKISHLLEALPSHFALIRRGKSMLVQKVDRVEEEELHHVAETAPEPVAVAEEAVEEAEEPEEEPAGGGLSQIDLLKIVGRAFDAVVKEDGKAYLPQITKEVKRIAPDLDVKSLGKNGLRGFIEEFEDIFTVTKEGRSVHVSRRKGRRQAKADPAPWQV